MKHILMPFVLSLFVFSNCAFGSQERLAISLSYDDALPSQLDHALPALEKYNFKASFYVVPTAPAFQYRLDEWREIAKLGHELGNHTVFHACSASKPNRMWVPAHNDLDKRPVKSMLEELQVANTLLKAIDGRDERTLTPPCFDEMALGGNYIEAASSLFIAIKSQEDSAKVALIAPANIDAQAIIDFIEHQPESIELVNILMHGVGGDHLSITAQEHEKLLQYLDENREKYWVDTYINIMKVLAL